jgi:LysR family nod box-dependent transcriptional activator
MNLTIEFFPDWKPSGRGVSERRRGTAGELFRAQFGRTRKPSIEEWLLLEYGVKRRIEAAVHCFSMIPAVLLGTERIATMHARLARHFAKTMPLRIVEVPVPIPPFTEVIQWPAVHNTDPASIWLRRIVIRAAKRSDLRDCT